MAGFEFIEKHGHTTPHTAALYCDAYPAEGLIASTVDLERRVVYIWQQTVEKCRGALIGSEFICRVHAHRSAAQLKAREICLQVIKLHRN